MDDMADLNIGDLDYGISLRGADQYIDDLKAIVLDQVSSVIEQEQKNVKAALDKGWSGASREKFDILFNSKCLELKNALKEEYWDLQSRLNELSNDFINQDQNMIID